MKKLLLLPILLFALVGFAAPATPNLGGKWQLSLTTPHGPMEGSLDLKQDGDKLTGTCTTDYFGAAPLSGTIDGKKVSFSIDVQGMTFTMSGTIDADKMTGKIDPDVGAWTATRAIVGSVVDIRSDTLEFGDGQGFPAVVQRGVAVDRARTLDVRLVRRRDKQTVNVDDEVGRVG
jgi:hypothetical protein